MKVIRWIISGFGYFWAFNGFYVISQMSGESQLTQNLGVIFFGSIFIIPGLLLGVVSMPKDK